jgi:GTP-binding protein
MFIDRAVVRVTGGTGGSGASSFARFKYKPKGGPDGGDGGHGGSVYVRGDANLATLLDYRYRTVWKADRGEHGKGKTQTGASAADVFLPLPPGIEIRDLDSGQVLG